MAKLSDSTGALEVCRYQINRVLQERGDREFTPEQHARYVSLCDEETKILGRAWRKPAL